MPAVASQPRPRTRPLPQVAASPPPFRLLAVHFVTVVTSAVADSVGLVLLAPRLAAGDFFAPSVLATVHLFTLGVLATAIFGVLHQFYPMALAAPMRSTRVAWAGAAALITGMLAVVTGFASWTPALLAIGWTLLTTAMGALAWNVLSGRRYSPHAGAVGLYVSAGHAALGLAILLAGARIGEILGLWTVSRLGIIAVHYHLAALGFGLLTVVGVGSRMVPMFLVSHGAPAWPLKWIGPLIGAGLLLFAAGVLGSGALLTWTGASFMAAGVVLHLKLARDYFGKRLRRQLDGALAHARIAFINLALSVALGALLLVLPGFQPRLWITYVAFGLVGFLVLLILGMLQKLMPHLGRLHLYRPVSGSPPPDANALLHQGASRVSLLLAELGLVTFAAGVLAGDGAVARIGAIAWLAAVVIIVGQFVRIVRMLRLTTKTRRA